MPRQSVEVIVLRAAASFKRLRQERRQAARQACRPETICRVIRAGSATPCSARIVDISVGGIGLLVGRPLTEGAEVELIVNLRTGPRTLQMQVIHVAAATPGWWLVGGALLSPLEAGDLLD